MSEEFRPRRSVLYMPGSNRRAMEKARTLPVDSVILDLEDAVAPAAKEQARQQVLEQVRAGGFAYREVTIRVNGMETPWFEEDLEMAVTASPDAIVFPKVGSSQQAYRAVQRIRFLQETRHTDGRPISVWAMIETPSGVSHVEEIAATEGIMVLIMGTSDLTKELRARHLPDRTPLLYALSRSVNAARMAGKDILDGVYLDLNNPTGFEQACLQGRDMGFDGKTLIHPSQIEVANHIFGPQSADIERAKGVLKAWSEALASGQGVAVYEGQLIENLHADEARRVVAFAEALGRRTEQKQQNQS